MENITYFESLDTNTGETTDWVLIDHGNEQFTSMPKAVYDAQQVEHLTEIPTP
jgi:hypothetical protein